MALRVLIAMMLFGSGSAETCFTAKLYDTFGDGWNGATITVKDCDGTVVLNAASIPTGTAQDHDFCTQADPVLFAVTVTEGSWKSELRWKLLDASGAEVDDELTQMANPAYGTFYTCPVVQGCMDPGADNYNPAALQDDGSCVCASYILMESAYSFGWYWSNYNANYQTILDVNGSTFHLDTGLQGTACYNGGEGAVTCSGRYYLPTSTWSIIDQATGLDLLSGDCGSNYGAVVFNGQLTLPGEGDVLGCTDETAFNYDSAATWGEARWCIPVVNGCTDPTAVNYSPLANTDDGSCVACDGINTRYIYITLSDSSGSGWDWDGWVHANTQTYHGKFEFKNIDYAADYESGNSHGPFQVCISNSASDCDTFKFTGIRSTAYARQHSWTITDENDDILFFGPAADQQCYGTTCYGYGYATVDQNTICGDAGVWCGASTNQADRSTTCPYGELCESATCVSPCPMGESEDGTCCPELEMGDTNGDGNVNVFDVVASGNHVIGDAALDACASHRSDMNGDGAVDVADIILIMENIVA